MSGTIPRRRKCRVRAALVGPQGPGSGVDNLLLADGTSNFLLAADDTCVLVLAG